MLNRSSPPLPVLGVLGLAEKSLLGDRLPLSTVGVISSGAGAEAGSITASSVVEVELVSAVGSRVGRALASLGGVGELTKAAFESVASAAGAGADVRSGTPCARGAGAEVASAVGAGPAGAVKFGSAISGTVVFWLPAAG